MQTIKIGILFVADLCGDRLAEYSKPIASSGVAKHEGQWTGCETARHSQL